MKTKQQRPSQQAESFLVADAQARMAPRREASAAALATIKAELAQVRIAKQERNHKIKRLRMAYPAAASPTNRSRNT